MVSGNDKMDNISRLAVKSRICDIVKGRFVKGDSSLSYNYLETPIGTKITKARILGTIVQKFISDSPDKSFAILTIDDSTETITLRLWNNLDLADSTEIGDLVDVIGLIREYNDEIYLVPDMIKKIDDFNCETLRRLEIVESLINLKIKKPTSPKTNSGPLTDTKEPMEKPKRTSKEDNTDHNKNPLKVREIVVNAIEKLDDGNGADIEEIVRLDNSAEDILKDLLNEGTCYEPRIGRVKLL